MNDVEIKVLWDKVYNYCSELGLTIDLSSHNILILDKNKQSLGGFINIKDVFFFVIGYKYGFDASKMEKNK